MSAGAAKQATTYQQALLQLARRIRAFSEGKFTPSPPPQLFYLLTDENLVVASDAVSVVGAEAPALSGNAVLKLLAWAVADAHGARTPLDKALALTVGKRLDRQAQAVRINLRGIAGNAESRRVILREAALGDVELMAKLPAGLEQINTDETLHLELACNEVYVGFHELDALQEAEDEPHVEPHVELPQAPTPPSVPTVYFEWLLDDEPIEDCPIPPDLVAALGREGVQMMGESNLLYMDTAARWWSSGLPSFTRKLICQVKCEKLRTEELQRRLDYEKESREQYEISTRKQQDAFDRDGEDRDAEIEVMERDLREVQGQLREAKGREDALHAVIHRCRWDGASAP